MLVVIQASPTFGYASGARFQYRQPSEFYSALHSIFTTRSSGTLSIEEKSNGKYQVGSVEKITLELTARFRGAPLESEHLRYSSDLRELQYDGQLVKCQMRKNTHHYTAIRALKFHSPSGESKRNHCPANRGLNVSDHGDVIHYGLPVG